MLHRFSRTELLVGHEGYEKLKGARVAVFGLGGVGSYAAEALARAAVGRLVLVDYDLVCATNVNRQLHAMIGTIGKPKAEVMAERCRKINPHGEVVAHLAAGDRLPVTALPSAAHVVRLGGTTFYERARRKLRVSGSAEVDY